VTPSRFLSPLLLVASLAAQDAPWTGTWKLASTPDIAVAIDKCTADLSFITRPIARSRLRKLNPAYVQVSISRGTEWVVQFENRPPARMPLDGKAVSWTREDGEKFRVSAKTTGDALSIHYQAEDGSRTNLFKVEGGRTLRMEVTVQSPKLSRPLTYALAFSKS
jgi:hypothetical protein